MKVSLIALATVSGSVMTSGNWLIGMSGLLMAIIFAVAEDQKTKTESE